MADNQVAKMGERLTRRRPKKVPAFWWDYLHHEDGSMEIVIECDDPEYPIIFRRLPSPDVAMDRLKDLDSGRLNYRRVAMSAGCQALDQNGGEHV